MSKTVKNSPKLHFGVTKKDPKLFFHFDVLNLFYLRFSIKTIITQKKINNTNIHPINCEASELHYIGRIQV